MFWSINLHCPLNYNPAEFYINAMSTQNQSYVEKIMEKYRERSLDYEETSLDTSFGHIQLWVRVYSSGIYLRVHQK